MRCRPGSSPHSCACKALASGCRSGSAVAAAACSRAAPLSGLPCSATKCSSRGRAGSARHAAQVARKRSPSPKQVSSTRHCGCPAHAAGSLQPGRKTLRASFRVRAWAAGLCSVGPVDPGASEEKEVMGCALQRGGQQNKKGARKAPKDRVKGESKGAGRQARRPGRPRLFFRRWAARSPARRRRRRQRNAAPSGAPGTGGRGRRPGSGGFH